MFEIGVWKTSVKTKRKVSGTYATQKSQNLKSQWKCDYVQSWEIVNYIRSLATSGLVHSVRRAYASKLRGCWFKSQQATVVDNVRCSTRLKTSCELNHLTKARFPKLISPKAKTRKILFRPLKHTKPSVWMAYKDQSSFGKPAKGFP